MFILEKLLEICIGSTTQNCVYCNNENYKLLILSTNQHIPVR